MSAAVAPSAAADMPAGMAMHAAMMVLLMDDAEATGLLSRLSPEELQVLGRHMCQLGEVAPNDIAKAIAAFASEADRRGLPAEDREMRVHSIMSGAVGAVRADSVMRRIRPERKACALELARWLEPEVITLLIEDELPQTIAVLLVQLDPQVAARILAALPDDLQADVVHRVATLGPVSPIAMTMLAEILETRINERFGTLPIAAGGVREAAEIVNQAGRTVERQVIPLVGKRDKKLARQLEEEMFRFEHLLALDAQQIGQLLREVESETLIDALKGVPEDQREVFFGAMSGRAADGLKDEIDQRGRIQLSKVNEAQMKIVAIARKLAADGLLILGGGDDDYV